VVQRYLIALGSNMRHRRHGRPEAVLRAALDEMARRGLIVEAASPVCPSLPVGPSRRRYANAAAIVRTAARPPAVLAVLQHIEKAFGRRRRGRRWRARVLDLDVILWDGGMFAEAALIVPHPRFREREFVLRPAAAIAGRWRDPVSGRTVRQLYAYLTRPRAAPN